MWIAHVPYTQAEGRLKILYDRVKGPGDNVDNIMLAHSLRPHSMEGHMALYKYVLHHSANTVPKWFLETIGVHVSLLNHCAYCVEHHFNGLKRLLGNDTRADAIRAGLETGTYGHLVDAAQNAALAYAAALTIAPRGLDAIKHHLDAMRHGGFDDGKILEINQVAAYFNYANCMVLGLGITTDGDILGLSPNNSNDENDWSHR